MLRNEHTRHVHPEDPKTAFAGDWQQFQDRVYACEAGRVSSKVGV